MLPQVGDSPHEAAEEAHPQPLSREGAVRAKAGQTDVQRARRLHAPKY